MYKKLEALNRELSKMDEQQNPALIKSEQSNKTTEVINPDIARLETMMQAIQTEPTENKELSQLNQMLDKIMQIQHPENDFSQDSLRELSANNKRKVFTVSTPEENIVSVIQPATGLNTFFENLSKDSLPDSIQKAIETNRFYSLDEPGLIETEGKAITAIIQENQTLVSGATVKLRVLDEMYIAGVHIPKDQFVYGVATLNGERLSITVSSITYNNYLLPVSLVAYDMDGLAGIHVPGAITRDVAKRSAAQSVQGLGTLSTLDPSFGAQMATAGLQAAQNLLGKSVKLIRVHLLSGYRVLLKDESRKNK
ncbi:MAG: conjugative transposon protein TraM [Agriterribacter sp.]